MWWKSGSQKAKEAAQKEMLDQALKSQEGLESAAKSTMGLASDVAGTLQAKIDEYANQLDMTARLLSDTLLMVDQHGKVTSYNKAAEEMFGWDKKEVVGNSMTKLFNFGDVAPIIDADWLANFCQKVNNETLVCGAVSYEDFRAVTKSGEQLYIDVSATSLLRSDHSMYYIILVRDVTHRVNTAQMIERLATKNQELVTAINASESGIVILEPEDNSFRTVFVNKGFEQMTGLDRPSLLDVKILDLIVDDGGQFEVRRNLLSHIAARTDVRLGGDEAKQVHAEVTITPVSRGSRIAQWILVFTDTTELVRAAEEVARSEAHFRAYAETSTECLLVHDSDTRILDWNSRLRTTLGYSDSELSKLSPLDLIHPLERQNIRVVVEDQTTANYETLWVTKGGEVLWVAVSSRSVEWDGQDARIAVVRDITPYRTVENQLATMRERYRSVVDNTIDLVCCFDRNFKITFTNQTFRDYFDLDVEDLEGFSLLDVIPEADHLKFIDYMHSITEDTNVRRAVHRVQRGDELRWQDWIDRGVFDETGELLEYQSVCRDVTHLMQQK